MLILYSAVFVDPVSRVSKTGLPTEEISSPLYPLDYGIKNSLIRLVKDTQGFENVYFDNMNIDGLVVKNITQYEVPSLNPLILHIDKFNTNVNISNVEVSDVDIIASNHDLIKIASAVSVKLTNASFTNINVNGYNLDTKDYQYLSFQGAVFYIQQQAALNQTVESKYTFDNITIDTVFASEGGAFYMADETGTLLSEFLHQIINISTLTVKNSVCKVNGMIKTYYVQFEISIHNSLFQNNTGVDCEADLSISAMWSLDIYNSSFIGSNTLSDIYARSMEFSLTDPYSSTPNLISVTVQWSTDPFTHENYLSLLEGRISNLNETPAIYLKSGSLYTKNCTFSNCFGSQNGGMLFLNSQSVSLSPIIFNNFEQFIYNYRTTMT